MRGKGKSKSQHVRELLATRPKLSADQVIEILGEQGVKISKPVYYSVKCDLNKKKKSGKKPSRKNGFHRAETEALVPGFSMESLMQENQKLKACLQAIIATLL